MMSTYSDLLIEDDELAMDAKGEPVIIFDRDVIAQDVRHRIRESQLLEKLVGERLKARKKLILQKLKIEVERDQRIVPGSCRVEESEPGKIVISATSEFGPVGFSVDGY